MHRGIDMDGTNRAWWGFKQILFNTGKMLGAMVIVATIVIGVRDAYRRLKPPECIEAHGKTYCLKGEDVKN